MLDEDGLDVFINEITYVDETERVTIANPNRNDLAGYRVALYQLTERKLLRQLLRNLLQLNLKL